MGVIEKLLLNYARFFPLGAGKMRVIDAATKYLIRNASPLRNAQLIHGGYIIPVDLRYFLQRQLYFFGDYWLERELIARWKVFARDAKVIFDVGANRGIYSLAAASVHEEAVIHAFEPTKKIVDALRNDILRNSIKNVTAHEIALSDRDGQATLHDCDGGGTNDGMNYITRGTTGETSAVNLPQVRTISTDEFCADNRLSCIDLMKIDVQGAEYDVLVGAERMLGNRAIRTIFVELNWEARGGGGVGEKVVEALAHHGFEFASASSFWVAKPAGEWLLGSSDLIATLQNKY